MRVLILVSALCHDVGHGPFSHMMENVLEGLGSTITHEHFGAALVRTALAEVLQPFEDYGVTSEDIGNTITRSMCGDSVIRCAQVVVASDFDVDRLDYLRRDAHYAGSDFPKASVDRHLCDAWRLVAYDGRPSIELTRSGCRLAEEILFARRAHYHSVVFSDRHMAASGMFDKALYLAFASETEFGELLRGAAGAHFDWRTCVQDDPSFVAASNVYQMTDYQALSALELCGPSVEYLSTHIRSGKLYETAATHDWGQLHHRMRSLILEAKPKVRLFQLSRHIEEYIAHEADVSSTHIVIHIPGVRTDQILKLGVEGGSLLEDVSSLGQFLGRDYYQLYRASLFLDAGLTARQRQAAGRALATIMIQGHVDRVNNI